MNNNTERLSSFFVINNLRFADFPSRETSSSEIIQELRGNKNFIQVDGFCALKNQSVDFGKKASKLWICDKITSESTKEDFRLWQMRKRKKDLRKRKRFSRITSRRRACGGLHKET
jgi:hypothetical protein